MGLSHEHVGPKILEKVQIYILTRAELLFTLCSEIPHRSKDFEAMKAGKLTIRPWLSCQYNENMLVDVPSSVFNRDIFWYHYTSAFGKNQRKNCLFSYLWFVNVIDE